MTAWQDLTQDQAVALLKQRSDAHDDLVEYAKMIDIPSVPLDQTEDAWEIVNTPLADHHLLTLNSLQAMVDGTLWYDPQTLQPVTIAVPDGLKVVGVSDAVVSSGLPPRRGSVDGGVGSLYVHAPSANSTNSNDMHPTALSPHEQNQALTIADPLEVPKITGVIPSISNSPVRQSGRNMEGVIIRPGEVAKLKKLVGEVRHEICRRVMVMMPPGSAKSTYASVVFPTWDMGRTKDQEIILTGWGDPICRRHGKRARTICDTSLYRSVFNTKLDAGTRAAEDWALENGSSYKSSGINSGVAGFRCDGLVWDDLTKNRKEADSETIRNDVYNAYIDDARSRKKPSAWEVGIGTRWHEDEIMGRLLPKGYAGESGYMMCRDGNVWLIICLAAECERLDDPLGREIGEMIWPEWFGEGYWAEKRMNARSWGSLYQQRPAPEEGIFFKREWFKRYDVLPEGDTYIGIDPAVTDEEESADADDTAILVWRTDEFARMYLVDEWVRAVTMDLWIGQLLQMCQSFKPLEVVGETGVIRRASEPFLRRAMRQAKAWYKFEWMNRSANKAAMARGAQAMAASGQIYVPNNSVGDRFIDDALRFPASSEDHRIDAFVNLCMRLEHIYESTPIKTVEEERPIISGGGIPISQLMPERFPKKRSRWSKTTALN